MIAGTIFRYLFRGAKLDGRGWKAVKSRAGARPAPKTQDIGAADKIMHNMLWLAKTKIVGKYPQFGQSLMGGGLRDENFFST